MPQPTPVEGFEALDVIIRQAAPQLAQTWPGDEALVGMIVEQPNGIAVVWAPRENVVDDLRKRGQVERDARRRSRYEGAVDVLGRPREPGKVCVLVAGWGDMQTIEMEADDLRTGKMLTSFQGGSS